MAWHGSLLHGPCLAWHIGLLWLVGYKAWLAWLNEQWPSEWQGSFQTNSNIIRTNGLVN